MRKSRREPLAWFYRGASCGRLRVDASRQGPRVPAATGEGHEGGILEKAPKDLQHHPYRHTEHGSPKQPISALADGALGSPLGGLRVES
jgi:hypothetical protein